MNARGDIVNVASRTCLDDTDDSRHPKTVMTQQTCVTGHTPEEWIFTDPTIAEPARADDAFSIKNV